MRATIRDVAQEAGVSVATVSRVLNRSAPAREETRSRVVAAAEKLHYAPNGTARSLVTRRTRVLGVLLPDLYGEFFSELIRGIDEAAQEGGYHLLVSISHNHRRELRAALRAMHGRVDGCLLMSPGADPGAVLSDLPRSLPVVLLNSRADSAARERITVDNFGGALAMTRRLLADGHRAVAFIRGPDGNADGDERLRGYRAALEERGLEPRPAWEAPGDFTESGGHLAASRLLEIRPRPTAVFAANDSMAIGALSAFREAGLRVPDDVALAGFDDIPIARYVSPPLSSVHVPIRSLGAAAVRRVVGALEEDEPSRDHHETLPTEIVLRASTGPVLADHDDPGRGRREDANDS